MDSEFCKSIYYGYIIKGDLHGAIDYVKQFPDRAELYQRYQAVFEQEQYITYEVDDDLNEILVIYQRYYREVFYLRIGAEKAEENLKARLVSFFNITDGNIGLCDIEDRQIAEAFKSRGFYFLGGRTSGYFGLYVWRITQDKTYEVELPDGIQMYTVKLLDGFITRSWMDYLSFGETGPGGWSNGDGMINCVKSAYDFGGEDFKVSLLKHEAQHVRDLSIYKGMSSEDLEYRAKLVELIYSSERNLLESFARQADGSDGSNGHSAAAQRIVEEYSNILHKNSAEFGAVSICQIQSAAKILFEKNNQEIQQSL